MMIRMTLSCFLVAASAACADFEVKHDRTNGILEIFDAGQPVAAYAYLDEAVKHPYFANVKAPNGARVTRHWPLRQDLDPMDHAATHPGIWMAFGRVNEADFCRGKSHIRHQGFVKAPDTTGGRLQFAVENRFEHEGKTIAREEATYTVARGSDGYYFTIDSHIMAVERLSFGDHQEMGLGIRMATHLHVTGGSGQILESEGRRNEAGGWEQRAAWCDYSGLIDGKRTGALLMPDPRNFRPSRFHSPDYGLIVANPFADKDFGPGKARVLTLGRGKRLRLQFGVYLYSLPDSETLDATTAYQAYLDLLGYVPSPTGKPWTLHTIDGGSRGADGVRLADFNDDGRMDVTTGWEQGSEVRVYLNPGPEKAKHAWPHIVAGKVEAPEDAVFIDLNGDGRLDVVSSTEGRERTVYAHFAPSHQIGNPSLPSAWTTRAFPETQNARQWMFALPLQVDGKNGQDLVLGSKGAAGQIGWLQAPAQGEQVADWTWHTLTDAGWIMSLRALDMDGDGRRDIVFSERDGPHSGIWWLENPADGNFTVEWKKHYIAGRNREVMFLDAGDLNGDGLTDIAAATKDGDIVVAYRLNSSEPAWQAETVPMPGNIGSGKAVALGDMDGDGITDLVATCEHSENAIGVFWMKQEPDGHWKPRDISGEKTGVKFDRIELIDLDDDGDLDVITCEERDNLGVIWYENPGA